MTYGLNIVVVNSKKEGQEAGDSFMKPNPPPSKSLSTNTMSSPLVWSTERYSPALLLPLLPKNSWL